MLLMFHKYVQNNIFYSQINIQCSPQQIFVPGLFDLGGNIDTTDAIKIGLNFKLFKL